MSAPPHTAGTKRMQIANTLGVPLMIKNVERMLDSILTTPEGMFNKAASAAVKPNDIMSKAENVEMVLEEKEMDQFVVVDTNFALSELEQEDVLLFWSQSLHLQRCTGKKKPHIDASNNVDNTDDDEHDSPPFNGSSGAHQAKQIADDPAKNATKPKTTVPDTGEKCTVSLIDKIRRQQHHTRHHCGLCYSKQHTRDHYPSEVACGSATGRENAPHNDISAQHLSNWKPANQVETAEKLRKNVGDKEVCGQGREAVPLQIQVHHQPHNSGVVQHHFIQKAKHVHNGHGNSKLLKQLLHHARISNLFGVRLDVERPDVVVVAVLQNIFVCNKILHLPFLHVNGSFAQAVDLDL